MLSTQFAVIYNQFESVVSHSTGDANAIIKNEMKMTDVCVLCAVIEEK